MKKLAFVLTALAALSLLAPTPGSAQVGTMGLYLDAEATTYEAASIAPGSHTMYLCLVEHDLAAVYGYEFGFTIDGTALVTQVLNQGPGPIDVGGGIGNHIVGLAGPLNCDPVTVIAQINFFMLDTAVSTFTLHGATPNSIVGSNTPVVLLPGDALYRMGVSGWDGTDPQPCLALNTSGVIVATDNVTLDGIKSLYR